MLYISRAFIAVHCSLVLTANLCAQDTNSNSGMYEKYKSEKQKFLDDFAGAGVNIDSQDLISVLLSSIHYLSQYSKPDVLPVISYLPTSELKQLACHSDCYVLGHYHGGQIIYLDNKLKPETNLFDRSVLLHELVHYLQYNFEPKIETVQTEKEKCTLWYKREREAYAIQDAYLMIISSPVRAGYFPAMADC